MNLRIISLFFTCLVVSACCTKKGCPGDYLPTLILKISGLKPGSGQPLMTYTLINGVAKDSTSIQVTDNTVLYHFAPVSSYDDATLSGKSFSFKYGAKTHTIENIRWSYKEVEISCNECFPFGHDKQRIKRITDFSLESGGKDYYRPDTLIVF